MARKKKPEEHVNHERWLVSYADFITLLFAFFVVLYSMSSVNEGKYRVLSDSMSTAFRSSPRSLEPIQIGSLIRSPQSATPAILEMSRPISIIPQVIPRNKSDTQRQEEQESVAQLDNIAADVGESFESLIEDEDVTLRVTPLWLEVEINSSLLFNSASAELSTAAEGILGELSLLLSTYPNQINVEGFTDDRPIRNSIYPSNWELSSARASAVVRLFADSGIEPVRMASVGYAEFKPTTDNDSEAGRARNRKVVVVVMANTSDQNSATPFADLELFRQRVSN